MSETTETGDTSEGSNKRQASSPAMGSDDEIKRRNVLSKLNIDSIDGPGLPNDAVVATLSNAPCEVISNLPPKNSISSQQEDELTLTKKVDLLTHKMDKVLEYLVIQKDRSDARDQINSAKFKLLEKSHNSVIDKLGYIDLDVEECRTKIEQNAINIESNEDSLNAVQTQLRLLKAADSEKSLLIKDMRNKMKGYDKLLRETQSNVLDLGQEIRNRSLIIDGVKEVRGEDLVGVAMDECNKVLKQAILSVKPDPKNTQRRPIFRTLVIADIDSVYRIGKLHKGRRKPRTISVSFSLGYIKHMIILAKGHMKETPQGFYIGEDLRPEARTHRSNLKQIAAGAKSLGLETKISGNKLTINSEVYAPDELPAIEEDVISASAHQKTVKDGIAFKGDRSVFSNFFPAPIVIDDYEYANVEQYFQYIKTSTCGYDRLARKILLKDNPWYCKATGGRATPTEEWKSIRLRTLYKGIFAKFDQNGPLKRVLLETDGLNLYEATTDPYWGCGIDIDSDKWETNEWRGENVCGKILVKVREEFLHESNLGRTHDDTLMDIATSMNSTTDPLSTEERAVSNSSRPDQEIPHLDYEEEWPSVADTSQEHRSYNEVVKASPVPAVPEPKQSSLTLVKSSTPKLTRGIPQVTPVRGRGRGNKPRSRSISRKDKFPESTERLTKEEKEFLTGTTNISVSEKNYKPQRKDKRQSRNPSTRSSQSEQQKTYQKNLKNKKSPQIENSQMLGKLSPKQKRDMSGLGLEPNSNFVQSIIAAKTK